jgi:succinyl-CoA synthetase beta subunit
MCGKTLITKQSGDAGFPCNCVYIVEKIAIEKEFYVSITLDRKAGGPIFIYSQAGGMAIEDVAKSNPEKIFQIKIDPNAGLDIEDLLKAAKNLGLE